MKRRSILLLTILLFLVGFLSPTFGQVRNRIRPGQASPSYAPFNGDNTQDFNALQLNASGSIYSDSDIFQNGASLDDTYVSVASVGAQPSTYIKANIGTLNVNTGEETPVTWTIASDTLSEMGGATGATFTATVAGYYVVVGTLAYNNTDTDGERRTTIFIDGVSRNRTIIGAYTGNLTELPFTCTTYLDVGGTIVVSAYQNSGSTLAMGGYLNIKRIPEPYLDTPQLATATWIIASYTSGLSVSDNTLVAYTDYTKYGDTLNELDTTTGSFTASVTGYYLVTRKTAFTGNTSGYRRVTVAVSGHVEGADTMAADFNPLPSVNTIAHNTAGVMYMEAGASFRPLVGISNVGTGLTAYDWIAIRRIPDPYADEQFSGENASLTGNLTVDGTTTLNNLAITGALTATNSYIITSSRTLSAAGGDVAYTGCPFQPSKVWILGALTSPNTTYPVGSVGFADTGNKNGVCIYTYENTIGNWAPTTKTCVLTESSGNTQNAVVKSFDSGGVTLTWEKTGSPSLACTIYLILQR